MKYVYGADEEFYGSPRVLWFVGRGVDYRQFVTWPHWRAEFSEPRASAIGSSLRTRLNHA